MSRSCAKSVEICNKKGLHARALAAIAREALRHKSRIMISYEGKSADASSIMDLLMLTAHMGCVVDVCAEGEDAEMALEATIALICDRFGEDE